MSARPRSENGPESGRNLRSSHGPKKVEQKQHYKPFYLPPTASPKLSPRANPTQKFPPLISIPEQQRQTTPREMKVPSSRLRRLTSSMARQSSQWPLFDILRATRTTPNRIVHLYLVRIHLPYVHLEAFQKHTFINLEKRQWIISDFPYMPSTHIDNSVMRKLNIDERTTVESIADPRLINLTIVLPENILLTQVPELILTSSSILVCLVAV